jgi:histidinol-phosphate/aromatic aminotransferase/cobyric acid decarboxylase-like protein
MKKVFAFAAIVGMAALASCGNAEALKKLADSLRADSIAQATAAAAAADSIKNAMTMDSANKAMAAQKMMDSLKQDSMDKATKKK